MISLPVEFPIEKYRQTIVETVANNQATIIVGPTGSGKTTREPLYIYEAGFAKQGKIGITEPRRIAAISAAEYVAEQVGCVVGEEVGFQIRFNDSTTEGTKIKFMTDGILLQEAKSDPLFSRYDVLVFDEAHECGINTDFALGLAKRALAIRDDLRVVVMSATIDAKKFAEFFGGAPIISIEGRMFPVEVRYIQQEDIDAALALFHPKSDQEIEAFAAFMTNKIHRSGTHGDILIFMPGEAEIHRTIRNIEFLNLDGLEIFAAYGNMSPDEQRRIFNNTQGRKVVVATNIAETSITIDGVVHVIDSGLIKESDFDPRTGIGTLKVVEHSKAGLEQRKGRAGRTQPGICWRLFTEEEYETGRERFRRSWAERRLEHTKPEIQRSDLAGVVLRLVGIGIKDVESFDFIDAPSYAMLHGAVETLQTIGALTNEREVTDIGWKLLDLPLNPKIGRMILEAEKFGCVREITAIAAKLSVREFFIRPKDKESEADATKAKAKFTDARSDLLTALAVMDAYEQSGWDRRWASENFLNWKAIEEALSIRTQLEDILVDIGIELTSAGYHLPKDRFSLTDEEKAQGEMIGKAVAAGFIQNLILAGSRHAYFRVSERLGDAIYIHPSGVLFGDEDARLIVSIAIKETTKVFARDCEEVKVEWLEEVAPQLFKRERSEPQRSFSYNNSGRYVIYERIIFNGRIIDEEEIIARGPEITRLLAKDIISGSCYLSLHDINMDILRRVEQLYIASQGRTKAPWTARELEEFYVGRLGDAASVEEIRRGELRLQRRDFVSEEEEEQFGPKISHTRHHLVEPPEETGEPRHRSEPSVSVFTEATRRVFPGIHESEIDIDSETQAKIDDCERRIEIILRDPEPYGYGGGRGPQRKTFLLQLEMSSAKRLLEIKSEGGERLLNTLSKELDDAFERVVRVQEKREAKLAKKIQKQIDDAQAECSRLEAEIAWADYQKRLAELKAEYATWPGFGVYTFPVDERGDPRDYKSSDGKTYRFDWDNTDKVLPEAGKSYWGFVSQGGRPALVVLLMEVMPKPILAGKPAHLVGTK